MPQPMRCKSSAGPSRELGRAHVAVVLAVPLVVLDAWALSVGTHLSTQPLDGTSSTQSASHQPPVSMLVEFPVAGLMTHMSVAIRCGESTISDQRVTLAVPAWPRRNLARVVEISGIDYIILYREISHRPIP